MANSSKKKSGLQRGESKAAFLFCTPAVVLALVFIIFLMNKAALTDSLIRSFLFQIIESSIRSL